MGSSPQIVWLVIDQVDTLYEVYGSEESAQKFVNQYGKSYRKAGWTLKMVRCVVKP